MFLSVVGMAKAGICRYFAAWREIRTLRELHQVEFRPIPRDVPVRHLYTRRHSRGCKHTCNHGRGEDRYTSFALARTFFMMHASTAVGFGAKHPMRVTKTAGGLFFSGGGRSNVLGYLLLL